VTGAPSTWYGAIREADWLNPRRARAYAWIFLAVTVAFVLLLVAASRDGLDPYGRPLGTDFVSFWTASEIALRGDSAAVYDPALHQAAQSHLFPGVSGYAAFFYPPTFLLACLPLAALAYFPSLIMWLAATFAALRAALVRDLGTVPLLAFPAVYLNAAHGQNGFLTAALLAAGARCLVCRPWLAGVLFGGLAIKPHLALAVPFALAAAGAWRALAGMAASVAALVAASLALFGWATWSAYLRSLPLARATLELGLVGDAKIQSVFAAVRLLGAGVATSYAVQGLVAAAVLVLLVRQARGRPIDAGLGAMAAAAAPLMTPFLLGYDLVLLAVPMVWLLHRARQGGFLPWEKAALGAAFVMPLISTSIAEHVGLQLAPLVAGCLFGVLLRRRTVDPWKQ
jgi:hypothetical protein